MSVFSGSEFRALRYAEQSPGNHRFLNFVSKIKGGVAMVKHMLSKAGITLNTALVTLGWLSFFVSFLIIDPTCVVFLQTIARVLP